MSRVSKLARVGRECVACGSCLSVCPKGAIWIDSGVRAVVKEDLCIGCGKCAKICPAAVIDLLERRSVV